MNTDATSRTEGAGIEFACIVDLKEIIFNPHKPEGFVFSPQKTDISFTLRPKDPANDGSGFFSGINYRVVKHVPAEPQQIEFVRSLIADRYLILPDSPISLPRIVRGEERIDSDGNIAPGHGLRFHHLPISIRDLCSEVRNSLEGKLQSFIHLLRWEQNIDSSHNPFEAKPDFYWRVQPGPFYLVPPPLSKEVRTRSPIGIQWDEEEQRIIEALWSQQVVEPLGHELMREAISLFESAPRSALLCLASALEAGLKQHLSNVEKRLGWLMENTPSPPIYKMLRDYLPYLNEQINGPKIDWLALTGTFKLCQNLAEYRNKLTHTGIMPENIDFGKYATAVSDVLYVLDYLRGHAWATENIENAQVLPGIQRRRPGSIYIHVSEPDD